jgi:Tfp pilus assembly protein PilX
MKYFSNYSFVNMKTNKQHGFIMVVVLIFMVVLMIVAISAMRSTKDDIAISGARYFRSQTYEQAQSSLMLAESCIIADTKNCGVNKLPAFDGTTPGWLSTANINTRSGANYWIGNTGSDFTGWNNSSTDDAATDSTLKGTATNKLPQYTIERMALEDIQGASLTPGPSEAISRMQPFRLTTRGANPNDGSTVILQRHIWTLPE